MVGALLTLVLIVAVLMLIVSAIVWAIATAHGNYATASKGRIGVLVSVGAAVLAGAGVAWMNWLLTVGSSLELRLRGHRSDSSASALAVSHWSSRRAR